MWQGRSGTSLAWKHCRRAREREQPRGAAGAPQGSTGVCRKGAEGPGKRSPLGSGHPGCGQGCAGWPVPAEPDGRPLSRLARRNHPSDGAPLLQNYVININQIMAGGAGGGEGEEVRDCSCVKYKSLTVLNKATVPLGRVTSLQ